VDENISKSHDLAEIGNSRPKQRIQAIESIERLSQNLELAFNGGPQNEIIVEIREGFAGGELRMAAAASLASHSRVLGSRLKDGLARPLNALLQIGIANRARLEEVDATAE
jgi:hypothetical protein